MWEWGVGKGGVLGDLNVDVNLGLWDLVDT
jgi:hypothetical protein